MHLTIYRKENRGMKNNRENSVDYEVIFTKYITLHNGRRLYASECGLKAFRLIIKH